MAFTDWSTTAASNVTVGGIGIGEGCPASSLNNAMREMMAELRAAFAPALAGAFVAATPALSLAALGGVAKDGDTVTGTFIRSGAGAHLHHVTVGFNSGRVFYTAIGASDPTSLAGDLWITGS